MKRIGIDTQALPGQKTGFGYYLDSVLKILKSRTADYQFVTIDQVKTELNTPNRMLWDQMFLPFAARQQKLDLLFVPSFSVPFLYRGKKLVTAHDLIGYLFSEHFSVTAKMYWKHLLPRSFRWADHIITVSISSRNDLERYLGIPRQKITVIPLAARTIFQPAQQADVVTDVLKKYGFRKDSFILTVGTIEPRKNLPRFLEAWSKTGRHKNIPLVIVGKKSWGYQELKRTVSKHELDDHVHFLDYLDDTELSVLYSSCRLFVMPSLYEGFGLPALEAMSCGAPTLLSRTSSLPEVGGQAAFYFDPYDVSDMAAKLTMMLEQEETRALSRREGLRQAKKFSWETCADQTLAVFDQMLA